MFCQMSQSMKPNVCSSPGNLILGCVAISALSILLNNTTARNKLEHWPGAHAYHLIASKLPGCFDLRQFTGKRCLSVVGGIAHAGINSNRQYRHDGTRFCSLQPQQSSNIIPALHLQIFVMLYPRASNIWKHVWKQHTFHVWKHDSGETPA